MLLRLRLSVHLRERVRVTLTWVSVRVRARDRRGLPVSVVLRMVVRGKGERHVDVDAQLLLHGLLDVCLVEVFARGRVLRV